MKANLRKISMVLGFAFLCGSANAQALSDEGFPDNFKWAKHYTWSGGTWVQDARILQDTTSGNPPTLFTMDAFVNGNYMPYQRFTLSYENGKNVRMVTEENTGGWKFKEKDTMIYDSAGRMVNRYKYQYNNGNWVNYYKNTYTYNTSGALIERFEEDWNGTGWQNDDDYFFNYDSSGRLTDILDKDWQGSWVTRRRSLVSYVNGVESEVLKQELLSGNWENKEKFVFLEQVTGITNTQPKRTSIQVYPNPANGILQLNIPHFTPGANITMYDLTGRLVKQLTVNENNFRMDISALPAGSYILNYTSNTESIQTQIIKE